MTEPFPAQNQRTRITPPTVMGPEPSEHHPIHEEGVDLPSLRAIRDWLGKRGIPTHKRGEPQRRMSIHLLTPPTMSTSITRPDAPARTVPPA